MSDLHKSFSLVPFSEASRPLFVGIDVGGTNIKVGLLDDAGQLLGADSISTEQERGAQDASQRSHAVALRLVEEAGATWGDIVRIGLATPGPMDLTAGLLHEPGNLPAWSHAPVRDLFAEAMQKPVTFANDAAAAAYGEYWRGAGAELQSLVLLTLGTGVGGGIVVDDRLIEGVHGAGAEIGHIIIDSSDDAPLNSLDIRGTLEGYCGSYGVVGRAEALLADHFAESSLRDTLTEGEKLTPLLIANAAEAGDALALDVVLDTAKYLALGIVTCIHMIDPDAVVLGGAMTFGGPGNSLGERFLAEVDSQVRRRILPNLRGCVRLEFARLGGDAGYVGAAGLARRDHAAAR